MDDFATAVIQTDETTIFLRSSGSGPPLLLLHGFPETHVMWHGVAPLLARNFTVVCADLAAMAAVAVRTLPRTMRPMPSARWRETW